jgi:hypothetical protein
MKGDEHRVLEAYPCDAANKGLRSELSGMTGFKTFVQSFAGMQRPTPRDRARGTARHEADPHMST